MFEVKRAVLGIRMSGSVAPDVTFSILTCMCVVAQNDQRVGQVSVAARTSTPTCCEAS